MFDALIIGGGAAGLSCALVLGSGLKKPFAEGKNVAILFEKDSTRTRCAFEVGAMDLGMGEPNIQLFQRMDKAVK